MCIEVSSSAAIPAPARSPTSAGRRRTPRARREDPQSRNVPAPRRIRLRPCRAAWCSAGACQRPDHTSSSSEKRNRREQRRATCAPDRARCRRSRARGMARPTATTPMCMRHVREESCLRELRQTGRTRPPASASNPRISRTRRIIDSPRRKAPRPRRRSWRSRSARRAAAWRSRETDAGPRAYRSRAAGVLDAVSMPAPTGPAIEPDPDQRERQCIWRSPRGHRRANHRVPPNFAHQIAAVM